MSTVIKHPVSDQVKPSFVIFDIQALRHCTHMAIVGITGLKYFYCCLVSTEQGCVSLTNVREFYSMVDFIFLLIYLTSVHKV